MTQYQLHDLLEQVATLARQEGGAAQLRRELSALHSSDIAELLANLDAADALRVFALLDEEIAPEVLGELDADTAALLHEHLPVAEISELLESLPMDDAAEVLSEAEPEQAEELLEELAETEPEQAEEIRALLAYKEQTAGRLMVTNYLSVAPQATVAECIELARSAVIEKETVYTIYVTEPIAGRDQEQLLGVVSLRALLALDPELPVATVMKRDPVAVSVDTDQAEVAGIVAKYDLLTVPVLGRDGELAGIITIDDVLDILVEEFNSQITRITGSDAAKMARRPAWQVARLRIPWLLGTLIIELCSGFVIHKFSWVLREVILLASFMPVISAVSGNTGLQAAAIAVRGIETGYVTRARRVLPKEMLTSLIIAVVIGTIAGVVGAIWSHHLPFGIVIGGGMFISMQVAGLMGTLIPIASKRLGFDPAATAGPFETAFQDVIGFALFLWLASLFLPWLK
jgi:magnesium transporter